MRNVFIQSEHEGVLDKNGYRIVDFLDTQELNEVKEVIKSFGYFLGNKNKLRISINQETVERKSAIYEKLKPVFQRAADRLMANHEVMRIGIFDKLPGGVGIKVHQHTNLVDESRCRSITTWIPLVDATVHMGTLHVVKGSHKFTSHIRSYNDYYRAFESVSKRIIKKHSIPLELIAGKAVIFDDRLIHWSPPNKSSNIRTAIQLELIPREEELIVHYRANENELLRYRLDPDIYRVSDMPSIKLSDFCLIGRVEQPVVQYRNAEFIQLFQYHNHGYEIKKLGLISRLLGM